MQSDSLSVKSNTAISSGWTSSSYVDSAQNSFSNTGTNSTNEAAVNEAQDDVLSMALIQKLEKLDEPTSY